MEFWTECEFELLDALRYRWSCPTIWRWSGAIVAPGELDRQGAAAKDIHYGGEEFITRSTMVFRKEAGEWRVVHTHFSEASAGERPGGV